MPHEEFHDPLAPPDPLRDWYVNTIWGKRVDDDDSLFEVMSLQVFQAGLTWRMILNKRDGFRSAFDNWSISTVAGFGAAIQSIKAISDLVAPSIHETSSVRISLFTLNALFRPMPAFRKWDNGIS